MKDDAFSCFFPIEDEMRYARCMLTGTYAALEYEDNTAAALALIPLARERIEAGWELVQQMDQSYRDQLKALTPPPRQPPGCAGEE